MTQCSLLQALDFGTLLICESYLTRPSNKPNTGAFNNDITPKKHVESLNIRS